MDFEQRLISQRGKNGGWFVKSGAKWLPRHPNPA
jgi:hypothetical protein